MLHTITGQRPTPGGCKAPSRQAAGLLPAKREGRALPGVAGHKVLSAPAPSRGLTQLEEVPGQARDG